MKRFIGLFLCLFFLLTVSQDSDAQRRLTGPQRGGGATAGDPLRSPTGGGGVSAATACSAATDYVGSQVQETASAQDSTADRVYIWAYTVSCASGCTSGSPASGYLSHQGTDSDTAKVMIWTKAGTDPGNGDALVAYTSAISSSATEFASASMTEIANLTCDQTYWIGFVTGTGPWRYPYRNTGETMRYKDFSGAYADPATVLATLGATGWTSATRTLGIYATVGP